jgi:hypothetical protein
MNEKGKVVAELCDGTWLWDLALCDISHNLNDLNAGLKCKKKLISDTFWVV